MKYNKIMMIALAALILLPVLANAQGNFGRQSGKVTDEEGNPLAGVTVTVQGKTETTDADGEFTFARLTAPQQYVFTFQKDGYEPAQARKRVVEGLSNSPMSVMLRKVELTPKQQAAQLYQQANQLMQNRKFEEALALFEQAMELDPEEYAYKANAGMCLYFMSKYEEALQYLKPASQAYSNNPMVITLTADSFFFARKFEEAKLYYEQLAKLQPLDAAAALNLAICYHELDQLDAALETINKALELEPENIDAYQRQAAIMIDQENYDGAMTALEKIYEIEGDAIDPKVKETLITMLKERGEGLLEAGKTEEALPYFEKIIKIAPDSEAAAEAKEVIAVAKEVS